MMSGHSLSRTMTGQRSALPATRRAARLGSPQYRRSYRQAPGNLRRPTGDAAELAGPSAPRSARRKTTSTGCRNRCSGLPRRPAAAAECRAVALEHLFAGRLAHGLLHLLLVVETGAGIGAADVQHRRPVEALTQGQFELDRPHRQPRAAGSALRNTSMPSAPTFRDEGRRSRP